MRTISLDLRERILSSYDQKEGTRQEIAHRFRVSLGLVKKLLQQRRRTGDIAPRHRYSGRKPLILGSQHQQMKALMGRNADMTLKELRAAMHLNCTLPAIHYALEKLGLTYKKRHFGPVSRTVPTSHGRAGSGGAGRQVLTRPG